MRGLNSVLHAVQSLGRRRVLASCGLVAALCAGLVFAHLRVESQLSVDDALRKALESTAIESSLEGGPLFIVGDGKLPNEVEAILASRSNKIVVRPRAAMREICPHSPPASSDWVLSMTLPEAAVGKEYIVAAIERPSRKEQRIVFYRFSGNAYRVVLAVKGAALDYIAPPTADAYLAEADTRYRAGDMAGCRLNLAFAMESTRNAVERARTLAFQGEFLLLLDKNDKSGEACIRNALALAPDVVTGMLPAEVVAKYRFSSQKVGDVSL